MGAKVFANKLILIAATVALAAFFGVWPMLPNAAAQEPEDGIIAGPVNGDAALLGPVIVGGEKWLEIAASGNGSFAKGCAPADPGGFLCVPSSGGNSEFATAPPWTFNGGSILTVTDAFDAGDQFEVFDNNVSIGMTSVPSGSTGCGSDPVPCFANPNISSGTFNLGGGAHSITMQLLTGFSGAAYFRVDPAPVTSVGGTTSFVPDGSGSSFGIPLLAGGVAAVVAIAAGGWYTRRRWLGSRS